MYIYIYDRTGSSIYVTFLPISRNVTYMEDPGISYITVMKNITNFATNVYQR